MTDWTSRDVAFTLDFLDPGRYEMLEYADGINADKVANDFVRTSREVKAGDAAQIPLAPGGGWAARLRKLD